MTNKKGEDCTNKSALKLQVTLCRFNYLNTQLILRNPESQKYHIYPKITFYVST